MKIPDNHNISESDLIQGCIKGERRMQELLYQIYSPKMYGVCLRYAGDADDAQDILQDGFVKVFRHLDRFRSEGSFEGWMRRIFVNTAIEHYRKKVSLLQVSDSHEEQIQDNSWSILDKLAVKDIIHAVQQLPPGYRAVFNLNVIEGYGHKEIAAMMGISEGTSKSQLARAKNTLQQILHGSRKSTSKKS
ncbi:MAG: RNA polymerase sigma factor [Chitinophagaceae bacterium]